ncbi:MAG TPA: SDR family NAD(P)-dependent oxidoreductase [Pyrinomonadaceae bacterium]|nr:SDR family NAD(P)-dependent oxidoreductase [Pyrinomonadaceae bacterium]
MSLTKESVVVLTGAASGIGRALAVLLAREGVAALAVSDVNAEGLEETRRLAGDTPTQISTHVVNVGDLDEMRRFADDVVGRHGRVTHLINNAGVSLFGTVEEVSVEDVRWLMDINFWGTVYGVKLFLPVMRRQPEAHVVNVSSVFGFVAPPGNAAYCASKFAVRGFTESLRHELEGTGVAVSCVHPGGVATNIARTGRVGAGADAATKEESVNFHTRASRTTAEEAARIIMRGIRRRSKRILVGADARLIEAVQRAAPVGYMKIMDSLSGGQISKLHKKSETPAGGMKS